MRKTPERIESLAAEYVLGSLRGAARRRFERWMMESARVRQEVWFWEAKLNELGSAVPSEEPPARVWHRIEHRLWPQAQVATADGDDSRRGWLTWLWPGWSLAATAAALVMAAVLLQQPGSDTFPRLSGAVVQPDQEVPLWLVSEDDRGQRLRLRPVAATAPAPGRDFELWVVQDEGQPLSLGVIQVQDEVLQITLDDRLRSALARSRTLAISLEPEGGSPTGAPTGPILHVTKLYEL